MRATIVAAAVITALILAALLLLFGLGTWDEEDRGIPITGGEPAVEDTVETSPDDLVPSDPRIPTFDIVRVDQDGTAVIAGRGAPDSKVEVLVNGEVVAETQSDENGEWVIVVETPLEEGAQELTLKITLPNGEVLNSEQKVVIAVPERPGEKPLVVLGGPQGGSKVLQNPKDVDIGQELALTSIDYEADGGVIFSGRADPNAEVRLYVDNERMATGRADENGRWELRPEKEIEPGVHMVRVDQVDEDGLVTARIELPFERESPEVLAALPGRVVVQPGNSLWRISRRIYGRGVLYTVIYEANKDQIRDPDLIYPGQVFETPAAE